MQFRQIEIDVELHKIIESKRSSFSESPNEILHRLLGGKEPGTDRESHATHTPEMVGATNEPNDRQLAQLKLMQEIANQSGWLKQGVYLPNGTQVQMRYNGSVYSGMIEDGKWAVAGRHFDNPSAATMGAIAAAVGSSPNLNGWRLWSCLGPGSTTWVPLERMRDDATASRWAR
jgi:hypothetical protein